MNLILFLAEQVARWLGGVLGAGLVLSLLALWLSWGLYHSWTGNSVVSFFRRWSWLPWGVVVVTALHGIWRTFRLIYLLQVARALNRSQCILLLTGCGQGIIHVLLLGLILASIQRQLVSYFERR